MCEPSWREALIRNKFERAVFFWIMMKRIILCVIGMPFDFVNDRIFSHRSLDRIFFSYDDFERTNNDR
jgi:hypothetical protein